MGIGKLLGKPNKLQGNDLRWTSIPSWGSRNTPSRFMLPKPGISSGSYDPVGSKASFLVVDNIFCCSVYWADSILDHGYKILFSFFVNGNLSNRQLLTS